MDDFKQILRNLLPVTMLDLIWIDRIENVQCYIPGATYSLPLTLPSIHHSESSEPRLNQMPAQLHAEMTLCLSVSRAIIATTLSKWPTNMPVAKGVVRNLIVAGQFEFHM